MSLEDRQLVKERHPNARAEHDRGSWRVVVQIGKMVATEEEAWVAAAAVLRRNALRRHAFHINPGGAIVATAYPTGIAVAKGSERAVYLPESAVHRLLKFIDFDTDAEKKSVGVDIVIERKETKAGPLYEFHLADPQAEVAV